MAKKQHKIFSKDDHETPENLEKLKEHINSPKFTKDEYKKLISRGYEDQPRENYLLGPKGRNSIYEYAGLLSDHKHNNPENNEEVLSQIRSQEDGNGDPSAIHQHGKLSKDYIKNNFDEYKDDLSENPSIDKDTIHELLDEDETRADDLVNNPNLDKTHAKKIMDNYGDSPRPGVIEKLADKNLLDKEDVKGALKFLPESKMSPKLHNSLLSASSPEDREDHINRKLGITGGSPLDEDNENWDNWRDGMSRGGNKIKRQLASSPHLTDAQAEHIKRHGDVESKWNLFNNPHVDPRHGVEMHEKWSNDDSEHGYDLDQIKDHIKEKEFDDNYDNYDQAREEIENEYPMHEWMSDNNIEEYDDDAAKEEINKNPHRYNTVGPNPDFDESKEEHPEENPKNIDFLNPDNSHSYDLHDHPDSDELLSDAKQRLSENNGTPDHLYDSYNEDIQDRISNRAEDLKSKKVDSYFEDEDNVPSHLRGKVKIGGSTSKRDRESKNALKELGLNHEDYPTTHEYGKGQHHLEMAKEYADNNEGTIGIDQLNKKHPNLKDRWKEIFGSKGKMSSDELGQKIEDLPKQKYNLSYGKWDGNKMQNADHNDQLVMRLDHSEDSYAPLKEHPERSDIFSKIQAQAQRSGHPTNNDTVAWTRIDPTNKKHWFQDELQSDFSKALRLQVENIKDEEAERAQNSDIKDLVHSKDKRDETIGHLKSIEDAHGDWREALNNAAIKLAKKHGVEKISTHSPESKAQHTGSDTVHSVYKDSYQKSPRSMGFVASDPDELPLGSAGKEHFKNNAKDKNESKAADHLNAAHQHERYAKAHSNFAEGISAKDTKYNELKDIEPGPKEAHQKLQQFHSEMAQKHDAKARELSPDKYPKEYASQYVPKPSLEENMDAQEHAVQGVSKRSIPMDSELSAPKLDESKGHGAHTLDLRPQKLAKSDLDDSINNIRIMLKSIQDRFGLTKSDEYEAKLRRAKDLIDLFRKKDV